MGYSFRDINIRLIWFKLNQMMEDIPTADRRQSYIVRLEHNPVLEELYEAVGLKTLVLDSPEPGRTGRQGATLRSALGEPVVNQLSDFLATLAEAAGRVRTDPGYTSFATRQLLEVARADCEKISQEESYSYQASVGSLSLLRALRRRVPPVMQSDFDSLVTLALACPPSRWPIARALIKHAQSGGSRSDLTWYVCRVLMREPVMANDIRASLVADNELDWEAIWGTTIDEEHSLKIVERFESEVQYSGSNADDDVAWLSDLALRLLNSQLGHLSEELRTRTEETLAEAIRIYPAIGSLTPSAAGPPAVETVLAEIKTRSDQIGQSGIDFEPSDDF